MAIVRYFDPQRDDGGFFPGVPKDDIDESLWNTFPSWLQASVDASPMYRKTPTTKKSTDTKDGA